MSDPRPDRGRSPSDPEVYRRVRDIYRQAFREHGNSVRAVFWPRDRQEIRLGALTRFIAEDGFSILDYGCGLAHLKPLLARRFTSFSYTGVDLVDEFVEEDRRQYPDATFRRITTFRDVGETFDHIVLSGVFNMLYDDDPTLQARLIRETLRHLFDHCTISLAVNFMTDRVDYRQPSAHHQNPEDICEFVRQELSPRLIIDQSYMPYEYTVTVFRDSVITRPDNIYRP
jgi:SAM-dependent methyltransferase